MGEKMIPQEYTKIRREHSEIIEEAYRKISEARESALRCEIPQNMRKATSRDIVEGNILWYPDPDRNCWALIDDVHNPSDRFKAFSDDDGCRRGLDGAFVET